MCIAVGTVPALEGRTYVTDGRNCPNNILSVCIARSALTRDKNEQKRNDNDDSQSDTFSENFDVDVIGEVSRIDDWRIRRVGRAQANSAATARMQKNREDGETFSRRRIGMNGLPDLNPNTLNRVRVKLNDITAFTVVSFGCLITMSGRRYGAVRFSAVLHRAKSTAYDGKNTKPSKAN